MERSVRAGRYSAARLVDGKALVAAAPLCGRLQDGCIGLSAKAIAYLVASCFALELIDESLNLSLHQATDAIEAHSAEG